MIIPGFSTVLDQRLAFGEIAAYMREVIQPESDIERDAFIRIICSLDAEYIDIISEKRAQQAKAAQRDSAPGKRRQ